MRLGLLRKEWFENKDCLDIGCNTGQVRTHCTVHVCGTTLSSNGSQYMWIMDRCMYSLQNNRWPLAIFRANI